MLFLCRTQVFTVTASKSNCRNNLSALCGVTLKWLYIIYVAYFSLFHSLCSKLSLGFACLLLVQIFIVY